MGAVRTTLTMEEFLQLPELDAGKRELLRGELLELPPAKYRHNEIGRRSRIQLEAAVAAAGIDGIVYQEMGYDLSPKHWLQPDVSITYPGQKVKEYLLGSPFLAVEIVSEYNTPRMIKKKIEEFLAHGAAEVWVLYPDEHRIRICRPDGAEETHTGAFISQLLGGYRIDLDQIFAA